MFNAPFNAVASPVNPKTELYYGSDYLVCEDCTVVKVYATHGSVDLGRVYSETLPGRATAASVLEAANGFLAESAVWAEDQRMNMIRWLSL